MYDAIKSIYPDIQDSEFSVRDDGDGPYIDKWDYPQPEPTESAIASADIQIAKAAVLARINAAYEIDIRAITSGYPPHEVDSWTKQEQEARAWAANNAAVTPWLNAAASTRRIPKAVLASKIITKANIFANVHGQLTGKRQRLEDQINALGNNPTQEQLDAIQW